MEGTWAERALDVNATYRFAFSSNLLSVIQSPSKPVS